MIKHKERRQHKGKKKQNNENDHSIFVAKKILTFWQYKKAMFIIVMSEFVQWFRKKRDNVIKKCHNVPRKCHTMTS